MDFCQSQKAIAAAMCFLSATTLLTAAATPGTVRVTLAWNASEGPNIAGYRLYLGVHSGVYTNMFDAGDVTSFTISNLVQGTTYYFAASAYDIVGLESALSSEVSYTVPIPRPSLRLVLTNNEPPLLSGTGPAGYQYEVLTTSDLQSWLSLGIVDVSTNGTFRFTDPAPPTAQQRYYRLRQSSPPP